MQPSTSSNIPMLSRLNSYGQCGLKSPVRGADIAEKLMGHHPDECNLISYLPRNDNNAILDPANIRSPTTHNELSDFVANFDLRPYGISIGCRVALILPNGPELAVCLLSTISRWCAAPINATGPSHEIQSELESTGALAVILLKGRSINETAMLAANNLSLGILEITPSDKKCGLFSIELMSPPPEKAKLCEPSIAKSVRGFTSFSHPETVLLLHTSGTSGNKKCVPYSLDMIIIGVGCIISSWNLSSTDVCLNMMPLFHIGGIMRNILSPLLSGGSVITCSSFDAALFWDILNSHRVTWYYAAPTMHHAILKAAEDLQRPLPTATVRYIANAAGGLLPVLAQTLKDTFSNAVILTSYGMTECMPISSPPQNYALDPTGTSGKAVGPDIMISNEDHTSAVPLGDATLTVYPLQSGNILIRGPPCFGGYENNSDANDESFFTMNGSDGWFDTGDTGFLDKQGYLFISGRSKEIINKGGETISPFEIEEQVQQHPSVSETLAFSAPHELYQETVGCVIVSRPGAPVVDLPGLHKFLESRLNRSKWPQVIIYMDALPKNVAGKILRIKLAERTALPTINDKMAPASCLYQAACPKIGTGLTVKIPIKNVIIDKSVLEEFLSKQKGVEECIVLLVDSVQATMVAFVRPSAVDSSELLLACKNKLPGYLVPSVISAVDHFATKVVNNSNDDLVQVLDTDYLMLEGKQLLLAKKVTPRNLMETEVEAVWREQIGFTEELLSVKENFFTLGGDSLKAGQVVNAMRKKFKINLSVSDLFSASTIEEMSSKVSSIQTGGSNGAKMTPDLKTRLSKSNLSSLCISDLITFPSEDEKTTYTTSTSIELIQLGTTYSKDEEDEASEDNIYSNKSCWVMFVQLLPMLLFYPLRKVSVWFFIAYPWMILMNHGVDRFISLVLAILISRIFLAVISPLVAIALKWLIIGRYRAGKYPLWGPMYLKWWLVEQICSICGKGIFNSEFPVVGSFLSPFYYRLMGAKVGNNFKVSTAAKLGQYDLLDIGDNVSIDAALVRPFSIEAGYFVMLPIKIGDGCTVCAKSSVVSGADIPSGTCIGPLSSTHEIHDASPAYKKYCRQTYASPPFDLILFPGLPLIFLVLLAAYIPWIYGLNLMVSSAIDDGWYSGPITTIFDAFRWWVTPQRIVWYFALRVIKECLVPVLKLTVVILIKRNLLGPFSASSSIEERNEPWNLFRYWLMSKLLPGGHLGGVLKLVGSHYEVVSMIYRLLGAKIGQRVYWPGSGVDIVEYDLLNVGNDVVFGSRSVILTCSSERSAPVIFEDGVMVADRCVILPGVHLKKGSVIGSGALGAEDFQADVGSVWVGSSGGAAVNAAPADLSFLSKDTVTPFGRAFYEGAATYRVITLPWVIAYNILWQIICSVYSNCSVVMSVFTVFYIAQFPNGAEENAWLLYIYVFCIFSPLNLCVVVLSLCIDICAKWLIIGQRQKGVYSWESSSYCQRWQVYLTIQKIHQGFLNLIHGSEFLCIYFRHLGASIGNEVCLYPNGGDPMMTEPELVTIGDYASIDDASIIAHINTRGVFKLNPLNIGNHCVLKSNCRLLSGASMESRSILLEHTLVLAGDSVDADTVWQGWPSEVQIALSDYKSHIKLNIDEAVLADRYSAHFVYLAQRRNMSKEGSRGVDLESERDGTGRGSEKQALLHPSSFASANHVNYTNPQRSKDGYSSIRNNDGCSTCVKGFFCQTDV